VTVRSWASVMLTSPHTPPVAFFSPPAVASSRDSTLTYLAGRLSAGALTISTTTATSTFAGSVELGGPLTVTGTATSTIPNLAVTTLSLNGEYYTSLLGTGLTRVGNVLTVDDTVFFSLAAWYATTTDALTEGTTNRYYSTLLFAADFAATNTDALSEGLTNLYYTDERVAAYISASSAIPSIEGSVWVTSSTGQVLHGAPRVRHPLV
jgi:hypothetical protein